MTKWKLSLKVRLTSLNMPFTNEHKNFSVATGKGTEGLRYRTIWRQKPFGRVQNDQTGTVDRKRGSGQTRKTRIVGNIDAVEELVWNNEDDKPTTLSQGTRLDLFTSGPQFPRSILAARPNWTKFIAVRWILMLDHTHPRGRPKVQLSGICPPLGPFYLTHYFPVGLLFLKSKSCRLLKWKELKEYCNNGQYISFTNPSLRRLNRIVPISVVRYPLYLDTYRRYLGDDTSIANVTIYRGIS